ncbi:PREDICTED: putative RING-H2 finger protein ATL21A [Nicotiana attenuata]|nr:PREDICTED: putative RING-H2 finger protein ATL21A [Nicotiana attenuata]
MDILKVLLIHLFLPFLFVHAKNYCPVSYCPMFNFSIRFPFYLENQYSQNCGYPGFSIKCNSQGYAVLNLPFSGDFLVQSIHYYKSGIELYDPDNCLARRLMNLNLSSSPFKADEMVNYTIVSCPSDYPLNVTSHSHVVKCISNSTTNLLAFRIFDSDYEELMSECNVIARNFSLASYLLEEEDVNRFGFISLTWGVPDCTACEDKFEFCGFENSMSKEIHCLTGSSGSQSIAKVIALSVAIPISLLLLLIFAIFLRIYCNKRRQTSS